MLVHSSHLGAVPEGGGGDKNQADPALGRSVAPNGIQPDILICRCEQSISREEREKIALFCNVELDAVIEELDKDFSIYEVPLSLRNNRLDELIMKRLHLSGHAPNLDAWDNIMYSLRNPKHEISIAVVGKYQSTKMLTNRFTNL